MAISRIGGLSLAGASRFGGLPLAGASRVAGLGPLPGLAPLPSGNIPAPTFYWPCDGNLVDLVEGLELVTSLTPSTYTTAGAVYGSRTVGGAGGSQYFDSVPVSRVVLAGWLGSAAFGVDGDVSGYARIGGASVPWGFYTHETSAHSYVDSIYWNPGLVGHMDELSIWLNPPAEWTAEAAYAALYNDGLGVVWRDGQWWEVAE